MSSKKLVPLEYVGPHPEGVVISLPDGRNFQAAEDGLYHVDEDVVEGLLEQEANWRNPAARRARKSTAKKAGQGRAKRAKPKAKPKPEEAASPPATDTTNQPEQTPPASGEGQEG